MGFLSRFEGKMEDTMEGAAGRMSDAPISPVQISKKAEKAMRREKMVGAGKQYAPTLYTVLVNVDDDRRLFGMYPTLAGEIETYLYAKAMDYGLVMDGQPLVRFIADESLRHGKFDVVAEPVAAPIVAQLRQEEMDRYGIIQNQAYGRNNFGNNAAGGGYAAAGAAAQGMGAGAAAAGAGMAAGAGAASFDSFDPYAPSDEAYLDATPYVQSPAQNAAYAAPQPQPTTARLLDKEHNRAYTLTGQRMLVGRGSDCDITIPDINCSRHHALLTQEAHGVWVITDQGSTNGTIINGRTITVPESLYEGTQITLGLTTLVFTMA